MRRRRNQRSRQHENGGNTHLKEIEGEENYSATENSDPVSPTSPANQTPDNNGHLLIESAAGESSPLRNTSANESSPPKNGNSVESSPRKSRRIDESSLRKTRSKRGSSQLDRSSSSEKPTSSPSKHRSDISTNSSVISTIPVTISPQINSKTPNDSCHMKESIVAVTVGSTVSVINGGTISGTVSGINGGTVGDSVGGTAGGSSYETRSSRQKPSCSIEIIIQPKGTPRRQPLNNGPAGGGFTSPLKNAGTAFSSPLQNGCRTDIRSPVDTTASMGSSPLNNDIKDMSSPEKNTTGSVKEITFEHSLLDEYHSLSALRLKQRQQLTPAGQCSRPAAADTGSPPLASSQPSSSSSPLLHGPGDSPDKEPTLQEALRRLGEHFSCHESLPLHDWLIGAVADNFSWSQLAVLALIH